MAAILCLGAGAVLLVGGAAVIYWPAAICVAGVLLVLLGIDLASDA